MNDPSTSAHMAESFEQRSARETSLHGRRLVLFWIGWALLVAYTLGVFFGSLPFYFAHLQTVCTRTPCISGQPLASTVLQLHGLGLSLASYALLQILLTSLVACVAFAVAGVLAWRKTDDWLALLASLTLVMLATVISTNTLLQFPSPWQVPATLLNILTLESLILMGCLFPNGRFVPRWTRWLPLIWLMGNLLLVFVSRFQNLEVLQTLIWFGGLAYLVGALLYHYRVSSTPVQRQQTKWIVFGLATTSLLTIGWNLPPLLFPAFAQPGTLYDLALAVINSFLLLPSTLCVAIAILRYRLWEIDVLINRTLVYGSLTALLALVYSGLVIGLQSLSHLITGQVSQSPVVIVASTLAIAALFHPLRKRIQAIIDHRFYRRKYDAAKTVAAFSATLRNEVDLNQLREHLLNVVQETMQPAHVSLWLRQPPRTENQPPQAGEPPLGGREKRQ